MDSVLIPVTRSPLLPQYITELQNLMAEEAVARQKFYDWLTPEIKAEFINGEVIVHSPAKYDHNDAQLLIARLLGAFVDRRRLGKVLAEKAMVELTRNNYEPDVCFWGNKKAFHFKADQLLFPAPDLVVEVLSPSTEEVDRTDKRFDYAAHAVQEYWIVDPVGRTVEQFTLTGKTLVSQGVLDRTCRIRSVAIDAFECDVAALFGTDENLDALLTCLR